MLGESLNKQVTIETRTRTTVALGQADGAWGGAIIAWGRLVPRSISNAASFGQRLNSETTHDLRLKGRHSWQPDLVRFTIEGVVYEALERAMYFEAQDKTTIGVKEVL